MTWTQIANGLSLHASILGTYQALNFASASDKLDFLVRSTTPGAGEPSPPITVAITLGGALSVSHLVDGPPLVVQIAITIVDGVTTAGELHAALRSEIDDINALDLGDPLVVVGRPLFPEATLGAADTTSGGTIDMVAGSNGSGVELEVYSPGSTGQRLITTPDVIAVSDAIWPLGGCSVWLASTLAAQLANGDAVFLGAHQLR